MNKNLLKTSVVIVFSCLVLVFLANAPVAYSASKQKIFGIRITKLKAQPIEQKEKEGYTCIVAGQTIEGRLVGSPRGTPTSYFIPAGVVSKSGGPAKAGNQAIGFYTVPTPIVCIRPPAGVAIVKLDTIAVWNTPLI